MSSSPVEYSIAPALARDPYRDRRPPYSEDAEQAVISAMLIDQEAVLRAIEHVDDTMFYAERHRRIFPRDGVDHGARRCRRSADALRGAEPSR